MDYAVILRIDEEAERKVFPLINTITKVSGNAYMTANGIPPHVSLSLFSAENEAEIKEILTGFAKPLNRFAMDFDSFGVFNPHVLFLAPVVTSHLINIHADLNNRISPAANGLNAYYLPNQWVPHMALGVKLHDDELLKAFEVLQKEFLPFTGEIVKIALAECEPYREVFGVEL